MEDENTNELCSTLMNEEPKIEYVIKNIITILLAVNLTNQATAADRERAERITPGIVIGCGRLLVKTINSFVLLDPLDWGVENPQSENQTGLNRIEEISRYRVAYLLWKRVVEKGGKTCKLFGKSYLKWCKMFGPIRLHVEETCTNAALGIPKETMDEFMEMFSSTFDSSDIAQYNSCENVLSSSESVSDSCLPTGYKELVWSTSFSGKLQERQQQRWGKVESNATWSVSADGLTAVEELTSTEDSSLPEQTLVDSTNGGTINMDTANNKS